MTAPHILMRRALSLPIASVPLPPGVALVPFTKETAFAGRELMRRVYTEGLGDGGITFEGFWTWLTSDPEYDPELMLVAQAAGVTVGFCHCWRGNFVKDLVVDAAFRRRGLGTALLTQALMVFAKRGAIHVDLKTEIENTSAQALYRRLGFEMTERVGGLQG